MKIRRKILGFSIFSHRVNYSEDNSTKLTYSSFSKMKFSLLHESIPLRDLGLNSILCHPTSSYLQFSQTRKHISHRSPHYKPFSSPIVFMNKFPSLLAHSAPHTPPLHFSFSNGEILFSRNQSSSTPVLKNSYQ